MKRITIIGLDVGLWGEWTSIENLEIKESFEDIYIRVNAAYQAGLKLIVVKLTSGEERAINMDYITDIWIKEVE